MKRKSAILVTGIMAAAMLFTGCESSKGLETEAVTISKYKGVEVTEAEKPQKVTDKDVESYIQSVRESQATTKEIKDRAVEKGDTANINFVGKIGGEEFDGGSAEAYDLAIGSGTFIEGFEDSVIGHKAGETYDWNGTFPEDYGNAEMAGKDVVFTITVNYIKEQELPKLDDKFVKSVSKKSKTVKEYKAEMKKQLTEESQTTYEETLSSSAWEKVLDNTKVKKYPKKELKEISDSLIDQYKQAANYYQMSYEDFIKEQMNTTVEEFEKQVQEAAKSSVKQTLVTEAIAEKENIKLDDKTYKKELKALAAQYGYEDVKALKEAAEEEDLKEIVLNNLVKDWLADNCIQVADSGK